MNLTSKRIIIIIILLCLFVISLQSKGVLYKTSFKNKKVLLKWKVKDYGTYNAPSKWQIVDGTYAQMSNIQKNRYYIGTTSVTGKKKWSNYIFDVQLKSTDDDILGVMFYYTDENNYYRLRLMGVDDIYKEGKVLEKVVNGKWTKLAVSDEPYSDSNWHRVRIVLSNNRIIVYYDDLDKPIFNVQDNSHSRGKIGLFSWANKSAYFDNIKVYTMPLLVTFTKKRKIIPLNKAVSIKLNVNNLSSSAARLFVKSRGNLRVVNSNKGFNVNKNQSIEKELLIKGVKYGKGKVLIVKNGAAVSTLELMVTKNENINLKPYFGDFHMHTTYSDGKNTPYEMVIQAKRVGLDVIAITDHLKTKGAHAGQKFAAVYKPQMIVIIGEENHKLLSFKSILKKEKIYLNDDSYPNIYSQGHFLIYNHPQSMNSFTDQLKGEFNNDPVKLMKWASANNILIFHAHPTSTKQPGTDKQKIIFLNHILKMKYVSGFENRATRKTKNRIYLYYHSQLRKGRIYPILANSDAHSTKGLGKVRTIVLAESFTAQSILDAMKRGKTVVMNRSGKIIDGPPHLVELVKMYIYEFLPVHDEYAKEEAEILRHIHGGHPEMKKDLIKMKQKWSRLYQKFFPQQ